MKNFIIWLITTIIMEAVLISQIPTFPKESLLESIGTISQGVYVFAIVLFTIVWIVLSIVRYAGQTSEEKTKNDSN